MLCDDEWLYFKLEESESLLLQLFFIRNVKLVPLQYTYINIPMA